MPATRALVVDIQSDALIEAVGYLGASVTIAHVDVDASALVLSNAIPRSSTASSLNSTFDFAIVDIRGWDRARIPPADQRQLLATLRDVLRPGGSLLTIALNPVASVWDEARQREPRARAAIAVASWIIRQAHPLRLLAHTWQRDDSSGLGLFSYAVFLPHPSLSDARAIRSPGAPAATALQQLWLRPRLRTRFSLRCFGHLLTREHIVLWSVGRGAGTAMSPLSFLLGGRRSTIIPMPTGPRIGTCRQGAS